MTYITADLDKPTRYEITKAWYTIKRYADNPKLQGRVSSGGYGVHIRSHPILPRNVPVAETQRRLVGDDIKRIEGDVSDKLCHNQVFFDSKGEKTAGQWLDRLNAVIQAYRRSVEILPELESEL